MLPLAGDRAITGAVAVADDQEGVVVEGVRDDVFVHVVAQVAVKAGANVLVDGLEFDEDQRQAVDEADEIGSTVVVRGSQPGQLQFAHGEEAIAARAVVVQLFNILKRLRLEANLMQLQALLTAMKMGTAYPLT